MAEPGSRVRFAEEDVEHPVSPRPPAGNSIVDALLKGAGMEEIADAAAMDMGDFDEDMEDESGGKGKVGRHFSMAIFRRGSLP
jgi:hypothetical protein